MKHLLFSSLAFLIAVSSYAYDVEIDGIYYNLNTSAKTVEVTSASSGRASSSSRAYSGNIVIPETIVLDGITYSVTYFFFCYERKNYWIGIKTA
ncbi:MAG: hypothetical protein KBT12_04845 [Bacteroidales bacterium]|nr:hypothetical protein [Candidatus Physcousia equi]